MGCSPWHWRCGTTYRSTGGGSRPLEAVSPLLCPRLFRAASHQSQARSQRTCSWRHIHHLLALSDVKGLGRRQRLIILVYFIGLLAKKEMKEADRLMSCCIKHFMCHYMCLGKEPRNRTDIVKMMKKRPLKTSMFLIDLRKKKEQRLFKRHAYVDISAALGTFDAIFHYGSIMECKYEALPRREGAAIGRLCSTQ